MKQKVIEILVKVPKDWLTATDLSSLEYMLGRAKDRIQDRIQEKVVDKLLKELEMPKIKIDKSKLEEYVYREMARRAIERSELKD